MPTPEPDIDPAIDAGLFASDGERLLLDAIIDQLPEFVPFYLSLAEACDDIPDEHAVLSGLAEFVLHCLAPREADRSALRRALQLVESLLEPVAESTQSQDPGAGAGVDSFEAASSEADDQGDDLDGLDDDDLDITDLVAVSFFDSFPPESLPALVPWLGPHSVAALNSLDGPLQA